MLAHIETALFLALPLVLGGALHMLVVRMNVLSGLRVPIHERSFGPNKTWRGVVVMPCATIFGVALAQWLEARVGWHLRASFENASPIVLGGVLGLAYVLAELPNSYVKRRLGVVPGGLPEKNRYVFAFVDQADSAIGCALAYAWLWGIPAPTLMIICILGPLVHAVANVTLFFVGLRARPL